METINTKLVSLVQDAINHKGVNVLVEDTNRSRILEAAYTLFNTRGYKSVTISDLAESVGISKKAIYQYFSGKEDIASAVIERAMGRISDKFDLLERPSEDPLVVIRSTFEHVKTEISRLSPLFQEDIRKFLPEVYQTIVELRGEKIKKIEHCIRAAQRMGIAKKTIDARLATLLFLEAAQGFSRSKLSNEGFSKYDVLDTLIDIFISGIASESP